eukprot:1743866-Pyramimonas_sp.AAC.1
MKSRSDPREFAECRGRGASDSGHRRELQRARAVDTPSTEVRPVLDPEGSVGESQHRGVDPVLVIEVLVREHGELSEVAQDRERTA